jgi:FAD/FMN-containing dehydrogenase
MQTQVLGKPDIEAFWEALAQCLSPTDFISGEDVSETDIKDWSAEIPGRPIGLALPCSTQEVSAVLSLCNRHNIPVVPQGGRTGLAGGAVASDGALLLSLARISGIEEIDTASATATVLAGTTLQTIQEAVEEEGMMFGLDLGPRGSCQIGGNISTNAGGNRVIRYGMTRDLVLGLEVVLADGRILSMLNRMPKNNAALDMKPLFIGSEGTLGVITRAVLKLHPGIAGANTALVALPDFESALALLGHARRMLSDRVSAFEVMWADYFDAVLNITGLRAPLESKAPLYVLIDMQGPDPDKENELFHDMLGKAMEQGWVLDAALAQSQKDALDLWALRDGVTELLMTCRPTINFDVSVPIAKIGECVAQMRAALETDLPEMNRFFFGHIGDSNIHLVTGPLPADPSVEHRIESLVYEIVRNFSGSVSAEHGIGLHKKPWLEYSRSDEELTLLRELKQTLDPKGILNPGKVL